MHTLESLSDLHSAASEATKNLTVDELAEFVDYLAHDDRREGVQGESWFRFVEPLFTEDNNTRVDKDLWTLLIDIHSARFMAQVPKTET